MTRRHWATVPNAVTMVRLLLVPAVCASLFRGSAAGVLLLMVWSATDWVDGVLARRLGQVSRVGEVIDPLADRLGIACILLTLAFAGLVPWAVFAIIITVDVLVGSLVGPAVGAGAVRVSQLGKVRTAVLMVGLVGVAAAAVWTPTLVPLGQVVLALGGMLHLGAGLGYLTALRAARALPRRTSAPDRCG